MNTLTTLVAVRPSETAAGPATTDPHLPKPERLSALRPRHGIGFGAVSQRIFGVAAAIFAGTMLFVLLGRAASVEKSERIAFEGSWAGKNSIGVHLFETATPLDPNNDRVGLVLSATADPTFGSAFPTAVRITNFHGAAKRSGLRTFEFTKHAVGSDKEGRIVYFLESSGIKEFGDAKRFHGAATLSIYLAGQDANGDGVVDDGQAPVMTIPYTFALQRVDVRL